MKLRNNQKGNVLFLILIAVALFAALSYAVTQSSRSGGDSGRETTILNAAELSQYPNQVRTAVLRMIIDGRELTTFEFNSPSTFTDLTDTSGRFAVFHPEGGGAIFQNASPDIMDPSGGNTSGTWYYNMEFEVPEIGMSPADATVSGNDLIAFLPGVSESVCRRLNVEGGLVASTTDDVPVLNSTLMGGTTGTIDYNMDDNYTRPIARGVTLDASSNELTGHSFGCFADTASGPYVYYHVINER